ncbi:MAG: lipid A deacylase LpxR family protein [Betaproteobacteria bacterium]|nr:MAG: lipid A deacylase LpxR family protein [Betaproteobacteria bacterium]
MNKYFQATCFVACLIASVSSHAQARCPDTARAMNPMAKYEGVYKFTLDNDLFSNRDQDYTNGVKMAWASPNVRNFADDDCLPPWLQQAGKLFTQFYSPTVEQGNVTVTLGQAMFTPRDSQATSLVVGDRPYAGWTYLGFGFNTRSAYRLDSYEVNLGVVGPWSRAKQSQDAIHRLRDIEQFQGWSNQLGNEFGAQLVFERKYRTDLFGRATGRSGLGVDVIPHYGVSLGNVATYINAGVEARFGWGLPDDFGTSPIRPAGDNAAPRVRDGVRQFDREVGAHVFVSLDGRLVARNIFLDGNTIRDSHSVKKERAVADVAVGVAGNIGVYKIAYVRVFRTREFAGQLNAPKYGSITISGPL